MTIECLRCTLDDIACARVFSRSKFRSARTIPTPRRSDATVAFHFRTGIIASKRCNNVKIFGNTVSDGGPNASGIFLHRSSDDAEVYSEWKPWVLAHYSQSFVARYRMQQAVCAAPSGLLFQDAANLYTIQGNAPLTKFFCLDRRRPFRRCKGKYIHQATPLFRRSRQRDRFPGKSRPKCVARTPPVFVMMMCVHSHVCPSCPRRHFSGNTITNMHAGITILESFGAVVYDNTIDGVEYGVRLKVGSGDNHIYDNEINDSSLCEFAIRNFSGGSCSTVNSSAAADWASLGSSIDCMDLTICHKGNSRCYKSRDGLFFPSGRKRTGR